MHFGVGFGNKLDAEWYCPWVTLSVPGVRQTRSLLPNRQFDPIVLAGCSEMNEWYTSLL